MQYKGGLEAGWLEVTEPLAKAPQKLSVAVRFDLETVALIRLTANEERLRHGTLFQIAAKSTGKNYHPSVP